MCVGSCERLRRSRLSDPHDLSPTREVQRRGTPAGLETHNNAQKWGAATVRLGTPLRGLELLLWGAPLAVPAWRAATALPWVLPLQHSALLPKQKQLPSRGWLGLQHCADTLPSHPSRVLARLCWSSRSSSRRRRCKSCAVRGLEGLLVVGSAQLVSFCEVKHTRYPPPPPPHKPP